MTSLSVWSIILNKEMHYRNCNKIQDIKVWNIYLENWKILLHVEKIVTMGISANVRDTQEGPGGGGGGGGGSPFKYFLHSATIYMSLDITCSCCLYVYYILFL